MLLWSGQIRRACTFAATAIAAMPLAERSETG